MHLSRLTLAQFRCHADVTLNIPAAGLRIVGANASGKTSLLEAIGLLATTRSFRGALDRDLIRWDSGLDFGLAPYGRVEAIVHSRNGTHELGVAMQLGDDGESVGAKRFLLDDRATTAQQMVGHLAAVAFTPEDVQLVIGPPADRRRALDILISQIDRTYMRHLTRYGRVLQQRNGLLRAFARDHVRPTATPAVTQLAFWDEQLVAEGGYLIAARARTVAALTRSMCERSRVFATGGPLEMTYEARTAVRVPALLETARLADAVTIANASLQRELEQIRPDEFRRGQTLTGPHRDDIGFTVNDRSLARFGSRGQQRLGVLAMKLAEADVIAATLEDAPVFLLDDVLSELDANHRALLLDAVAAHGSQVFLTSAEVDAGLHPALAGLAVWETAPVDAD